MNEINYNFKNVVYTARFILSCKILINLKSYISKVILQCDL